MKQLLEAGVHFGHQTRRWNPKMKRFIFGERNGIYIIDLNQTLRRIDTAYSYVRDMVAGGGTILFVGTKKQTQDPIANYAAQCGMPYINERWLGGMLTNFSTIAGRVKKMQEYERMMAAGDFEAMPKKEALILSRELEKLQRNLGGIRGMSRLPDAIFVIDTKKEHIAVTEANKLGLPIVAVVDTNCDPDVIQYVIPGNDDAIRAGNLMCRVISDAVEEGRFIASRKAARAGAKAEQAGGPPMRTAEDEARFQQQQREAARQAAVQAQEREARLVATRTQGAAGPDDAPEPEPAATDASAGTATPAPVAPAEPAPEPVASASAEAVAAKPGAAEPAAETETASAASSGGTESSTVTPEPSTATPSSTDAPSAADTSPAEGAPEAALPASAPATNEEQ
jgi:small subunit ribosomal protein S2